MKDCFKDLLNQPAGDTSAQQAQRAQRHVQFEPMLRSSPQLQQVLQGVATVAQITLLQPLSHHIQAAAQSSISSQVQPGSHPQAVDATEAAEAMQDGCASSSDAEGSLCVVNTHLFFHPQASHVRNIHTAALLSEVEAFISASRGSLSTAQTQLAQADVLEGQPSL